VPLAEAVEFARPADVATELPAVVYRCIEYLLAKNAVAEEGIFRLSGSNTVIKALKDRFNNEGDVNLLAEGNYHDIHAVASLLKLYLRELPSSILTRELHLEFLQCLERHGKEKVAALNVLVNQLPKANRALVEALSSFLLSIVNNAEVNKMNVRNGKPFPSLTSPTSTHANSSIVGIVFAPTLNVPAPLISSFVEDQSAIFGAPIDEADSPIARDGPGQSAASAVPTDLRSPRKQMFSDLPTPAYNQTTFQAPGFQSFGALHGDDNTGMIPMHPSYANYQMAPQGDGGFGSLNDVLKSPTVYNTVGNGVPTSREAPSSREAKAKRRESGMLGFGLGQGLQKKGSMSKLSEEEGASF
jgi:RalA-binding protein 1